MISNGYVEAASVVASSGSEKRAIGATSESNCSGGIFCAGSCSVVVVVITGDWAWGAGVTDWPDDTSALAHKAAGTAWRRFIKDLGREWVDFIALLLLLLHIVSCL
jgi:hypothetical protein